MTEGDEGRGWPQGPQERGLDAGLKAGTKPGRGQVGQLAGGDVLSRRPPRQRRRRRRLETEGEEVWGGEGARGREIGRAHG